MAIEEVWGQAAVTLAAKMGAQVLLVLCQKIHAIAVTDAYLGIEAGLAAYRHQHQRRCHGNREKGIGRHAGGQAVSAVVADDGYPGGKAAHDGPKGGSVNGCTVSWHGVTHERRWGLFLKKYRRSTMHIFHTSQ